MLYTLTILKKKAEETHISLGRIKESDIIFRLNFKSSNKVNQST